MSIANSAPPGRTSANEQNSLLSLFAAPKADLPGSDRSCDKSFETLMNQGQETLAPAAEASSDTAATSSNQQRGDEPENNSTAEMSEANSTPAPPAGEANETSDELAISAEAEMVIAEAEGESENQVTSVSKESDDSDDTDKLAMLQGLTSAVAAVAPQPVAEEITASEETLAPSVELTTETDQRKTKSKLLIDGNKSVKPESAEVAAPAIDAAVVDAAENSPEPNLSELHATQIQSPPATDAAITTILDPGTEAQTEVAAEQRVADESINKIDGKNRAKQANATKENSAKNAGESTALANNAVVQATTPNETEAALQAVNPSAIAPNKRGEGRYRNSNRNETSDAKAVPTQPITVASAATATTNATEELAAQVLSAELPADGSANAISALEVSSTKSTSPVISDTQQTQGPRLPQHLLSRGGESNGTNRPVTEFEQVRLLSRVAKAFQAAEARGGEIRLKLTPPHLGTLKLEMRVEGNSLTAHVEAETSQTRSLLLDNLQSLRDRLAELNIRVDKFNVDVRDQRGENGQFNNSAQDGTSERRPGFSGRQSNSDAQREAANQPINAPRTIPSPISDDRLNVII